VAAIGGCLTVTVAGALEARGIAATPEKLEAEVEETSSTRRFSAQCRKACTGASRSIGQSLTRAASGNSGAVEISTGSRPCPFA
jgi:hypothetical protein